MSPETFDRDERRLHFPKPDPALIFADLNAFNLKAVTLAAIVADLWNDQQRAGTRLHDNLIEAIERHLKVREQRLVALPVW